MKTHGFKILKTDIVGNEPLEKEALRYIQTQLIKMGLNDPILYEDHLIILETEDKTAFFVSCGFSVHPYEWVSVKNAIPKEEWHLDVKFEDGATGTNIIYRRDPLENKYGFFDNKGVEYFNITHFRVKYISFVN